MNFDFRPSAALLLHPQFMNHQPEACFSRPPTGGASATLWRNGGKHDGVTAFLSLGIREERPLWMIWTTGKPGCGPDDWHEIHFGDGKPVWLITPVSAPAPGLEDWMTAVRVDVILPG